MSKKTAIFTIASGKYAFYAPIFRYCANKAYPNCDCLIVKNNDYMPNEAAAMRFLVDGGGLSKYDNVLIEDVDVLLYPGGITERMEFMLKNKLICYSNVALEVDSVPGVQLVTWEWFERTEPARLEELENLKALTSFGDDLPKGYDERMLYRLIASSGLPRPPQALMGCHGIHLGAWRKAAANRGPVPQLDAIEQNRLAAMLDDRELMRICEECADDLPLIADIFRVIRKTYRGK